VPDDRRGTFLILLLLLHLLRLILLLWLIQMTLIVFSDSMLKLMPALIF
jgi:hypothetical protein